MWIKSVIHTLDIQDSVHDVVSISTINKCRMEPRLSFTLRILACELLKMFILKSVGHGLDILPWQRALSSIFVVIACTYCLMYSSTTTTRDYTRFRNVATKPRYEYHFLFSKQSGVLG